MKIRTYYEIYISRLDNNKNKSTLFMDNCTPHPKIKEHPAFLLSCNIYQCTPTNGTRDYQEFISSVEKKCPKYSSRIRCHGFENDDASYNDASFKSHGMTFMS